MIVLPDCFNAGDVLYLPFDTYDSNGASVTITGLLTSTIEIYKNGSTTQRASDSGYALLDTDGIDFDGVTGLHGFSIDTGDDADAGFWADGNQYWINVNAITVDGQTVRFTYYLALGYSLRPTTKGRQLDVSAGGEAGIDWANIGSPTTSVALSGTSGLSLASTGLDAITVAEPAGEAQFGTTTLVGALGVLLCPVTNKKTFNKTTGVMTQRNNADDANLWTTTATDDGTTRTIGKAT